jgi:hypothetical protein
MLGDDEIQPQGDEGEDEIEKLEILRLEKQHPEIALAVESSLTFSSRFGQPPEEGKSGTVAP